jgi:DNA mismatch repair protein MutS
LEVTNTHKDRVPADWIRKQTLTNGERYITQELKENINRHLNTYNSII